MLKKISYLIFCFTLSLIINLYGYNFNGVINFFPKKGKFSSFNINEIRERGLNYLNKLREKAGLLPFLENPLLDEASQNHANYLNFNNVMTHYETQGNKYFTGITPQDRVFYVGYEGGFIGENISAGDPDITSSVDSLFSAIYHRFGFLNFKFDELGIGVAGNFYVYDMGSSKIRILCEQDSYFGSGSYYYNVCKDKNKKIASDLFEDAMNYYYENAPKYIIWPYDGENDVIPVFYEEFPDPLPECSVSGYPISIEFNPGKINENSFQFKGFHLYDENGNEISNVKILTHDTDPNGELSKYQFALMPLERLDWDKDYLVKFVYIENGNTNIILWQFHTKKLDYPVIKISKNSEQIEINKGEKYYIYFEPENCNDIIHNIQVFGNLNLEYYDGNTILISTNAPIGSEITVLTDNGKTVRLKVSNKSQSFCQNPFKNNFKVIDILKTQKIPSPVENVITIKHGEKICLQPSITVDNEDVGKIATLIMYISFPNGFGFWLPKIYNVQLNKIQKIQILSKPLVFFSDYIDFSFDIYFGYITDNSIKLNDCRVVIK